MAGFPVYRMPIPPVLTPAHMQATSFNFSVSSSRFAAAASSAWTTANSARIFPFTLTDWATAYQLLFYVGATSSGNIDVGIYDEQNHRIVSAGSTAMSATTNTVQELNITDTVLPPGNYLLAGACDNTTGTVFRSNLVDEASLASSRTYIQTGLTAAALPEPLVPALDTDSNTYLPLIGIQLRSVF